MKVMTMTRPFLSEIGHPRNEQRKLARACAAAWPSGDAMAFDLAEQGIEVTPRTCNRWRSGQTNPSDAVGQVIRRLIIKQSEQQIEAARARIAALRS